MKRVAIMLWAVATLIASGQAERPPTKESGGHTQWKGVPEDWTVEAKIEADRYQVGAPIPMVITMRNVSPGPKFLVSIYPFIDYVIEIKDAGGIPVPVSANGKKMEYANVMSRSRSRQIESGGIWSDKLNLSEYFELSKPATYHVLVRRYYSFGAMISRGKNTPKTESSEAKPVSFTISP